MLKNNIYADFIKGAVKLDGIDLYNAIVENREIGEECELHDFSIPLKKQRTISEKWQCSKCGTVVDYRDKKMYELGIAHIKNERSDNITK